MKSISLHRLICMITIIVPTLTFSSAWAASHNVEMKSISFEPRKIEAKVGDNVIWQNAAYTQHSATSDEAGVFDTGLIEPKHKSKAVTLSKAGTFFYHCSIHGKTMHGEIVVKE